MICEFKVSFVMLMQTTHTQNMNALNPNSYNHKCSLQLECIYIVQKETKKSISEIIINLGF